MAWRVRKSRESVASPVPDDDATPGTPGTASGAMVLLHVGLPKTATTAVQSCLAAMRPELLEQGILYPGRRPSHVQPLRAPLGWEGTRPGGRIEAEWNDVAASVRAHAGRAVVSGETAAVASPAIARRIVDDLGGERVHVVITVRPLEALLGSTWQQDVKLGSSVPLEEWLDDVTRGPRPADGSAPHVFWYVNDLPTVVRNWMSAVGPGRVHLVVVDPQRPRAAFDAFEQLLGLDPGVLDPARSERSNRSLTVAETEVIRRLNERAASEGSADAAVLRRTRRAANYMIERRRPAADEARVVVPRRHVEAIREVSRMAVAELPSLDIDIIGDLDDLCPSGPIVDAPPAVVDSVPLDAAVLLLEGLALLDDAVSGSADVAPRPT